jgi:GR25 family glycosyltransferase involved in LPS biosynthesis
MKFSEIPKYVINLERRSDRLESITNEMNYIGWEFELFKAVDTNSHVGCSLSHIEILKIAKERNYESVLIIEDDCKFMPYAKSLLSKIEEETVDLEFAILNLSPTLNRPVTVSNTYQHLLDITNLSEKLDYHRDIFATNMILYHNSIYDDVLKLKDPKLLGHYAIDDFIFKNIISSKQSYSPILPIAPQTSSWSDVSGGMYNNFYTQTYNWNLYSPCKIPQEFLSEKNIQELKTNKIHKDFYYVN